MTSHNSIQRSFEEFKYYLRTTLIILTLNGVGFIILLGDGENQKIALIPVSITIPLLVRLSWLFGDNIKRIYNSYNDGQGG
jgi:hypothetical protein